MTAPHSPPGPPSAPAPDKVQRRKDARPAEIIAASIGEFESHGFQGASINRIAKAAGIAKGTVYLYFPSKEALFLSAIEEQVADVMGQAESNLALGQGTTRDLLIGLLTNMYRRFMDTRARSLFRILISEGDRMPDVMAGYHDMTVKRGSKLLTSILERGVARGEVIRGPVFETPQVIIAPAVYFSIHSMMFSHTQPLDYETYFAAHIDVILNGILVGAPQVAEMP